MTQSGRSSNCLARRTSTYFPIKLVRVQRVSSCTYIDHSIYIHIYIYIYIYTYIFFLSITISSTFLCIHIHTTYYTYYLRSYHVLSSMFLLHFFFFFHFFVSSCIFFFVVLFIFFFSFWLVPSASLCSRAHVYSIAQPCTLCNIVYIAISFIYYQDS